MFRITSLSASRSLTAMVAISTSEGVLRSSRAPLTPVLAAPNMSHRTLRRFSVARRQDSRGGLTQANLSGINIAHMEGRVSRVETVKINEGVMVCLFLDVTDSDTDDMFPLPVRCELTESFVKLQGPCNCAAADDDKQDLLSVCRTWVERKFLGKRAIFSGALRMIQSQNSSSIVSNIACLSLPRDCLHTLSCVVGECTTTPSKT